MKGELQKALWFVGLMFVGVGAFNALNPCGWMTGGFGLALFLGGWLLKR